MTSPRIIPTAHRVTQVDPREFTQGHARQRERWLEQGSVWADEHGRPWSLRRIAFDFAVCAAVVATPFILWSRL